MPTGKPLSTLYVQNPTEDLQVANKQYVDAGGGATVTRQLVSITSDFTTTSDTQADVTGLTMTMANRANGFALVDASIECRHSAVGGSIILRFVNDGVNSKEHHIDENTANYNKSFSFPITVPLDGQIVKVQARTGASTLTIRGNATGASAEIEALEVS